jgi:YD repeat-containing protein
LGANSADTPVPIGAGAILTENLLEDAGAIEAERANNYPLLDTLRRWVAPYDGTISINAPVNLIQDTSPERAEYTGADGVRVAIQLEGAELWSTDIAADDYTPKAPTGVSAVPVLKGQRLYFRVQSKFDGAFDQVAWNPEIAYLNVDTARTDVNELPEYRYRASDDFTFAGRSGATTTLPLTGTLRLGGTFEKTGVTTDDVRLVITRNGIEVFSRTLGFAETATVSLAQDLSVSQLDVLEWRVFVDSPVDATKVRLVPQAFYTAAEGLESVTDEQGNFVVRVEPPFEMDLYTFTTLTAPQGFYTVPTPATTPLPVQARIQVNGLQSGEIANAVFTVKRRGARLAKVPVEITGTGSSPVEVSVNAQVDVNAGDQLFFDLSSRDTAFSSKLALLEVTVGVGEVVPSALHARGEESLFPQAYRGWGAAGYNGNAPRDGAPVNQALLVLTAAYDPQNARVYPYAPLPAKSLWGGVDELAWVKAGSASASRLGLDDIRMPRSEQFAGQSAPARISRSVNTSLAVGISHTSGTSESQLEFMDLNGDRFPDILSNGGVQFSRAVGGLEPGRRSGRVQARTAETESFGLSTSGAGSIANAIGDMRAGVSPFGYRPAAASKQGSDMPTFAAEASGGTSKTQFELIDVNGDGLPDKVFRNGSVALNLGYSFLPAEPWIAGIINDGDTLNVGVSLGFNLGFHSLAGGLSLSTGVSHSDETYIDINGDGLPDKVKAGSVRLNTGAGFTTDGIPWPGGHGKIAEDKHISLGGGAYFTVCIPLVPPVVVSKLCFNPGVNFSTSLGRPEVSFRDMDGDGFVDHVFSERDSQLSVALNPIGRTNLLKKVHRPLGATFDLEYTRDGNRFELPQSRWLMTRVTVFDGHVGEGADRQVLTFAYTAANYNRLEREFYGYGTVVERHHDTQAADALFRSIQRDFLTTSYYSKGLLVRELTSDALGRPFVETQNTYVLRDVDLNVEPVDGTSTTATIFPQLARTDKRFHEGGMTAQKSTATLHQYDPLGNMSRFVDTGDVGATDDVDAVISYTATDPACMATYIVGKPRSIVVTGNGALMRQREANIDCTTGDVTQVRQFLESGQPAVSDLTYFPSGNIQSVTGPANRNGQRYRLDYLYDPTVDTYVARITDSFGLFSTAEYDLRFGKPMTTTDINGQRTTYAYDVVGRIDTIVGPYEGTGQITIDFDFAPVATPGSDSSGNTIPLAQVPFAFTKHIDKDAAGVLKSSGTIDTILFIDGLKRVIQTKKDLALHVGPDAAPAEAMTVSGQVSFDAFGRTVRQFYPKTEPKGANTAFNPEPDGVAPTTMTYDVLDRNTRTTIPDGTFTTLAYGFGADRPGLVQFETTVTDANGKVKQTYREVRELITSVKEFNQGATIWTSYAYDPLKQIVRVVDDKLNATAVAYDNLGRRTVIDNPDAGRTETQYDLASNVIRKITANLRAESKAIDYNYDFNRLTAITYPNFPGNNVSYTYGAPGAAGDTNGNRAGRVTRITSQMGQEERFYGRLGEVVKEVKTIVTAQTPNAPEVYTTLYQYDTWNRLMRMTYPDGEVLTYAYDSGGLVNFAQGQKSGFTYDYLRRLEYDKFEQRAFVEAGNNVRTRYRYDDRTRRLCGLTSDKGLGVTPTCVTSVEGTLPVQNAIQNLLYVYDNVGNIKGMANSIPVPQPNEYGGPTRQTFVYDDLHRLTSGAGTYSFNPNKTRTYQVALGYDSIHNILSKSQSDVITQPSGTPIEQKKTSYLFNYAYNPSGASSLRPHAPIHIGERTFRYDANGNQTGWDHDQNGTRRNIVWDEENRIQSLFDNGHEKTYKYDDQGSRVIKRGPQGETVYVNQYFTIRNKEIGTKHVFAGTSRLVS